ncbi:MAG TPA: NUDIX hydrolase [Candidatus Cybelea sp.]|nr:NUDIX hydrolase [Candidatus Cybelea sp.]
MGADSQAARPRPARPRDAASLILFRRTAGGIDVLMGRRAKKHKFLPDVYAFPGGRLDAADLLARPSRPLRADVVRRMTDHCSALRAQALAIAAVREAHEETGLMLGETRDGALLPDLAALDYLARAITPSQSPIRFHARFFFADASAARGRLGGSGELIDLDWRPTSEALRLPLADVTEFILAEIGRRLGEGGANMPAALWGHVNGRPRVRRG